jgi:hypothetical protein
VSAPNPQAERSSVSVRLIGDERCVRRLLIEHRGARLHLTQCACAPLAAAIEVAAICRWMWGVAPDDAFPAIRTVLAR